LEPQQTLERLFEIVSATLGRSGKSRTIKGNYVLSRSAEQFATNNPHNTQQITLSKRVSRKLGRNCYKAYTVMYRAYPGMSRCISKQEM